MGSWKNNDGLYLKYGTTKTVSTIAGEYRTTEEMRQIEILLDLTTVSATAGTIIADATIFPKGARIVEVKTICHTAADSTSDDGVLNLGLIALDRSTEIDYNGILAAFPQASMDAAGEEVLTGLGAAHTTTYAGALIGTTTSAAGYLCADYDTHAFTAGLVRIKIGYYMP